MDFWIFGWLDGTGEVSEVQREEEEDEEEEKTTRHLVAYKLNPLKGQCFFTFTQISAWVLSCNVFLISR
jgi:hypothetical protein